ncbi:hypothetical protein CWI39_0331p0010 [Hamiltosporidium magnivora]|uniref:Uncharacterized protein n=1 Tax=Hamiltosporidium magnivora TaxID=148818 RepID=A0A4Q9LJU0_9MICR|nr:hypothetical protein CWI39_0331p0010 [Hamiltosporidium magnivora]
MDKRTFDESVRKLKDAMIATKKMMMNIENSKNSDEELTVILQSLKTIQENVIATYNHDIL